MKPIKELSVYTNGAASDYRTWSNVPYFFTEALRAHGIQVNMVDINPYSSLEKIYNRTFRLGWKFIHPHTTYTFFRSGLRHRITNALINVALKKYPNSQADVFLTYSFSPDRRCGRPVVLLSDWPYSYSIEYFRGRSPDLLEAMSIAREDRHIEDADLVITLFQSAVEIMKQRYRNNNIHCIGQAINAPFSSINESTTLPEMKAKSYNLLFIGNAKYVEGLRILILAYKLLKESFPELTLTIIGHDTSYLEPLPDGVISYGYLDKGQYASRNLFFDLLKQARIYVNTTPKWGGFSSILEALDFYTPVVVTPFHEIVQTFGMENNFVMYCEKNTPEILAERIRSLLEYQNYPNLARKAHASVVNFTWNNYIDRLLNLMETKL
jgi:glycosyltransferase involved in cell wall biosynthesis